MSPLNVLHLRDTYEIGGPGKTILETHRHIDPERVRLQLAVFQTRSEHGDTPFVAAARDGGLPVHVLRGFNQYDPKLIRGVVDLVGAAGIDIVHAHEVKSDVIALLAALWRRVPIVTTLHGWIGSDIRSRALIALDKHIVRWFDRVIVVSRSIHDEVHRAGVPAKRICLLHNAIVVDRYRRVGRRGALAELAGREVEPPLIASIGRLSPEKGHADLIEALGILARRGRLVSTILIGDGPERVRLTQRVHALGLDGRVFLPGHLSRPQDILEETDLMVLPSHTEGLPNVALEALAMEVPVLATHVGGTSEVIVDGETGRLVAPRSPEALALGIEEFLASPVGWRDMAIRGRAVVESEFDFGTRTRKLERLYAEVASERRK